MLLAWYFHSIYITLGIMSHLDIINSTWEDVCVFHANTTHFYIRHVSMCTLSGLGDRGVSWNQSPTYSKGEWRRAPNLELLTLVT